MYFFIYNITLINIFWVLLLLIINQFLTLQSFNNFSFNSFYVFVLTTLLFSIAGVPPFVGFFSKLLALVPSVNNDFFLMYSFLFIILFVGLYFYIQNIRFLHSTNYNTFNYPYLVNERLVLSFNYFTLWIMTIIIFGAVSINDIHDIFFWVFI